MPDLEAILEDLRCDLHASRVTLRRDIPGDYAFPVTHEVVADGVPSIRHERTVDLRNQPVVRELLQGRQVVQPDCAAAYDDPAFQRMLETYGGLAAQIVTPIFAADRVIAVLSVHQLALPRSWTEDEIAACTGATAAVGEILGLG
jgi:GAF domain-containing protein